MGGRARFCQSDGTSAQIAASAFFAGLFMGILAADFVRYGAVLAVVLFTV